MDRFVRFKILRALWARARALLAAIHVPLHQHQRLRAQYWQQVNLAERQIRDGVIRSTGDPDAYVALTSMAAPEDDTQIRQQRDAQWQAQEAQRQWYEAQRQWHETQHRNNQHPHRR